MPNAQCASYSQCPRVFPARAITHVGRLAARAERYRAMQHTTPTISFSRSIEDEDVQSSDELMHKSRTDGPGSGRRVTQSRRVSNAFFPPGFAKEMETYEDEASGVTFQAGYDSLEGYQPPKVLMYDAERVLSTNSAWRALFTQTFHATALSSRNIFRKLMVYSAVAIVFIIMALIIVFLF